MSFWKRLAKLGASSASLEPVTPSTPARPAPSTRRSTADYHVVHYHVSDQRVVVAFASRGFAGAGEPIEEFAGTLSKLNVSTIYVSDRQALWWNHAETEQVFREVADLCAPYASVGLVGDSMGASGAILFTRLTGVVDRVLAFNPQYSIASPFIQFDQRYREVAATIPIQYHLDFAVTPEPGRVQVLFGDLEWEDYLHAAMFRARTFPVTTIADAPHDVAYFLKHHQTGNRLLPLLARFCDFARPFDAQALREALGDLRTESPLRREAIRGWEETYARNARVTSKLDPPAGLENLALYAATDQSSISPWSLQATTTADSAGAVNGLLTGRYSFHTHEEPSPWWRVDLGRPCEISEVRIYNRLDTVPEAMRFSRFVVEISDDGQNYEVRFESEADADPLSYRPKVVRLEAPVTTRFVRIRLRGRQFLHLDEVEVFGRRSPAAEDAPAATGSLDAARRGR